MNFSKNTQFLKLALIIATISLSSCSKDDDNIDDKGITPSPVSTIDLKITTKTEEDQMGAFADNAMALFDGKVWSIGGDNSYGGTGTHNTWTSTNGINWVSVAGPFPDFIKGHTLTTFNDQLWLIGGENSTGDPLSTIWHYDGTTWASLPAPFGNIGHHHSTVILDSKMYVIGASLTTFNTLVWSTTNGIDWVEETPNAPFSGRVYHEAVAFDGFIYIIGGEDVIPSRLNDIWRSSDGVNWTQVTTVSTIFSERNKFTATLYNDKVWVIAGEGDSSIHGDIWYSSDMINWTEYEDIEGDGGIHSHSTLLYNDALWVFGGYEVSGATGRIVEIKEF